MSDKLNEVLVQKITTLIDDVAENNILIRRMESGKEGISRMNERLDATQMAVREIETLLQGQTKEMEVVRAAIGELKMEIKKIQDDLAVVQTGIVKLPEQISIPHENLDELKRVIENLWLQLRTPREERIKHHHYLAKSSLLNVVFIGVIVILGYFLINALADNGEERGNAFKYRWLRISPAPGQIKFLQSLDSLYLVDPAGFRDSTAEEERRKKEAYENWLNLTREKEDVKEREERAKRGSLQR